MIDDEIVKRVRMQRLRIDDESQLQHLDTMAEDLRSILSNDSAPAHLRDILMDRKLPTNQRRAVLSALALFELMLAGGKIYGRG
jgi:hypothetical protein